MNILSLPWRFLQSLSWSGRLGLIMSLFWLLMAVFGTPLAPHSIDDIGGGPLMGGLTSDNLLGTDYLGRDMLSRILYGAKFSIGLALSAALLASLIARCWRCWQRWRGAGWRSYWAASTTRCWYCRVKCCP